jgi:hypothetical protein
VFKGEEAEQAVRTVVCRGVASGPKKDRWCREASSWLCGNLHAVQALPCAKWTKGTAWQHLASCGESAQHKSTLVASRDHPARHGTVQGVALG